MSHRASWSNFPELFFVFEHLVVELRFGNTLNFCDNLYRFSFSALAKLLLIPCLVDLQPVEDRVFHSLVSVQLVFEAKSSSLLSVAKSFSSERLGLFFLLLLGFKFSLVSVLNMLVVLFTKFSSVGLSLLRSLSKLLFEKSLASVRVSLADDISFRSTFGFPEDFSQSLVCSHVVLVPSVVLLGDNLHVVRLTGVVTGSEQEHKTFSLQWGQVHVSHVYLELGNAVSRVQVLLVILSDVASSVLLVVSLNNKVRWEVLEIVYDLLLGSQRVVKGVSFHLLLPVWHARVLVSANVFMLRIPVGPLGKVARLDHVSEEQSAARQSS